MEQHPKEAFNKAIDHVEEYIETQKEIVTLKAAKHAGAVTGHVTALAIVLLFMFVFYLLFNLALVFKINTGQDNLFNSFLLVAAGNLFLAIVLFALRKSVVIKPVQNFIIKLITE